MYTQHMELEQRYISYRRWIGEIIVYREKVYSNECRLSYS